MDELKLKFNGGFLKGIVARIIKIVVSKKLGFDIDIQFNDIEVIATGDKVHIHLNVDAETTTEEFEKMVKTII